MRHILPWFNAGKKAAHGKMRLVEVFLWPSVQAEVVPRTFFLENLFVFVYANLWCCTTSLYDFSSRGTGAKHIPSFERIGRLIDQKQTQAHLQMVECDAELLPMQHMYQMGVVWKKRAAEV